MYFLLTAYCIIKDAGIIMLVLTVTYIPECVHVQKLHLAFGSVMLCNLPLLNLMCLLCFNDTMHNKFVLTNKNLYYKAL